jgi:hypothetical protein
VEFHGDISNPNVSIWYLIGEVLRNAFIEALYPALDNSVNINSVGTGNQKPTVLGKEYQKAKTQ